VNGREGTDQRLIGKSPCQRRSSAGGLDAGSNNREEILANAVGRQD
jgi:hypothetical protein